MSFTSQSSPAQREPAWKRLGLKLKATPAGGAQPAAAAAPAPQPSAAANNSTSQSGAGIRSYGWPSENRRKRFPSPTPDGTPGHKRVRFDTQESAYQNGQRSFARDYTNRAGGFIPPRSKAKDPAAAKKKKQTTKKPKKPAPPPGLGDQHLEYLERYKNDRASWKFNTNSQTLLIKYIFVDSLLPASHIDIFYEYLRDLKGMTRIRLLETAQEIIKEDQKKNTGFGEDSGTKVDKAALEKMQAEYDEITAHFSAAEVNGNGKRARRISEVEYVLRSANPDVQRRIRRRIRAENVAAELSDGESTTSSGGATTATSDSQSTGAGSSTARGSDGGPIKNDAPEESKKRTRKKKVRSNLVDEDDTSSSEEGSDEESSEDESSSSSSEEESEDEEMPLAGAGDAETSSSSSSSSSDEGSEEDDEDDDDDEEENGGGAQI